MIPDIAQWGLTAVCAASAVTALFSANPARITASVVIFTITAAASVAMVSPATGLAAFFCLLPAVVFTLNRLNSERHHGKGGKKIYAFLAALIFGSAFWPLRDISVHSDNCAEKAVPFLSGGAIAAVAIAAFAAAYLAAIYVSKKRRKGARND